MAGVVVTRLVVLRLDVRRIVARGLRDQVLRNDLRLAGRHLMLRRLRVGLRLRLRLMRDEMLRHAGSLLRRRRRGHGELMLVLGMWLGMWLRLWLLMGELRLLRRWLLRGPLL